MKLQFAVTELSYWHLLCSVWSNCLYFSNSLSDEVWTKCICAIYFNTCTSITVTKNFKKNFLSIFAIRYFSDSQWLVSSTFKSLHILFIRTTGVSYENRRSIKLISKTKQLFWQDFVFFIVIFVITLHGKVILKL